MDELVDHMTEQVVCRPAKDVGDRAGHPPKPSVRAQSHDHIRGVLRQEPEVLLRLGYPLCGGLSVSDVPPRVGQSVPDASCANVVVAFLAYEFLGVDDVVQHQRFASLYDTATLIDQAAGLGNVLEQVRQSHLDQLVVRPSCVLARSGVGIGEREVHDLPGLVADRLQQDVRVQQ